ncbi:MAG: hypothetical protein QNJ77_01160 [Acidimicrobiia bacterium]|nr:hypothetical protein [Acidimicrobiia bacterium]
MKRHPFDPVSFIFGVLFLAVGIPMMFSERGFVLFEGRWVAPAVLIVAGAVVLAASRRRSAAEESVLPDASVGPDIDELIR